MIVAIIIASEIGFWVLLALGLIARYGFGLPRVSAALLISVPVVDVVLLVATVVDLNRGATATAAHGLAAAYIAFSIAYGHRTIRAIDARVAHRFAGGPAIEKPIRAGRTRVRHEWTEWMRALLAWAIAASLLAAAIAIVGDTERTAELQVWLGGLSVVIVAWFIFGPVATSTWVAITRDRATKHADTGQSPRF